MAGFFGIGDYTKAGKGISKDEPSKGGLKLFFEILGVRFWKLIVLNIIYIIACIPVITIGPATAGVFRVLQKYSIDRNAFVWLDFKNAFKENFLKAFAVGIIDIIAYTGMICGFILYTAMIRSAESGGSVIPVILLGLTLSFSVTFTVMNYYIYLMIVSTKLSMKQIVRNSVLLAFAALKQNMTAFVFNLVLPLIPVALMAISGNTIFLTLYLLIPSLVMFIICFCCYPVIQKYVIDPFYSERGEKNPEKSYNESEDDEEILFEDMGGKEQAVVPKAGSGKGKVIS
ncbi:YesL family protein [Ruminococcus sp. HUN007]|uniref:YesL family protein n=1 Tax=Ruminococcus sp. HUN007 TaxID=1514668 RepID=UPI0005D15369|nr:YesL family protein [Ruminococcus sp. HUN007]